MQIAVALCKSPTFSQVRGDQSMLKVEYPEFGAPNAHYHEHKVRNILWLKYKYGTQKAAVGAIMCPRHLRRQRMFC